jgi:hypothetical protein
MNKLAAAIEPRKKKPFVIRESPVWLDQHQDWISDGARQLYKTLRTLADATTGRLFIPGRGWITLRTVEQKSGMSHNTRNKYMRELAALGAFTVHRDYVTRRKNGRNLKVLGPAQITVRPLECNYPHKQRLSPTAQNGGNANLEPQDCVSPTAQSPTAQAQNSHLQPNSCAAQGLGRQYLSKDTKSFAVEGGDSASVAVASADPGVGSPPLTLKNENGLKSLALQPGEGQKAPTAKPLAPTPDISPLAIEKQKLIANLTSSIFRTLSDDPPDLLRVRRFYQKAFDALAVPFQEFCKIYESVVQAANLRFAPTPSVADNPFVPFDGQNLDQLVADNPGCLNSFVESDGTAVLEFKDSCLIFVVGDPEPFWHPFP